jgi:hypothetical protein
LRATYQTVIATAMISSHTEIVFTVEFNSAPLYDRRPQGVVTT